LEAATPDIPFIFSSLLTTEESANVDAKAPIMEGKAANNVIVLQLLVMVNCCSNDCGKIWNANVKGHNEPDIFEVQRLLDSSFVKKRRAMLEGTKICDTFRI
jgi:hypothetical protein